jgi:predicted site-specific integrase-resolvase
LFLGYCLLLPTAKVECAPAFTNLGTLSRKTKLSKTAMQNAPSNPPSQPRTRAAQYLRMSTEHQQYSIANQSATIALYAAAHNIGIVRAFVDEGKSGTSIKGRTGLQELIRMVESGEADFDQVLVYDVSRWGRFPFRDIARSP